MNAPTLAMTLFELGILLFPVLMLKSIKEEKYLKLLGKKNKGFFDNEEAKKILNRKIELLESNKNPKLAEYNKLCKTNGVSFNDSNLSRETAESEKFDSGYTILELKKLKRFYQIDANKASSVSRLTLLLGFAYICIFPIALFITLFFI